MTNISPQYLSHPSYRSDIDGLRAVAILAVVLFHAFPSSLRGGFIGVDIFFVISGFLISKSIFEGFDKNTFNFTEFYSRRVKRIFPALIVVLVACVSLGWFILLADEYKQLGKHVAGGAVFISNLMLWNEAGYFDNSADTKPLLHLWSLAVEEQFYILWPLMVLILFKFRINILIASFLLAVASFYLNVGSVKADPIAAYFWPHTRFWELMVGCFLASIQKNYQTKLTYGKIIFSKCQQYNLKKFDNIISIFAIFFIFSGFYLIDKSVNFPGYWALIPVLGTALIIFIGPNAWVNKNILSNRILVFLGLISFPLYLWHWPLLSFVRIFESEVPSRSLRIGVVIVSILLAWLTYRFVERPVRFNKGSAVKMFVLITFMTLLGGAGWNIYTRDGYELRNSVKGFLNNKNELIRTPAVDDDCLKYTGLNRPLFPYCRYTNAYSNETVAVIGDSHAHVAYPGIAEYLQKKGVNTLMMANSGCPPFIGSYTGINLVEKEACKNRIEQLLNIITKSDDIRRVFIFTRGPIYNTGTEPITGNRNLQSEIPIPIIDFANSAQLTVDRLSKAGKSVFYVTENPELSFSAASCLDRPFKTSANNCLVDKRMVLNRQADYLNAFNKLKNVTIINSIDIFCPQSTCILFDEKVLLYADDDHLSVAGSKFQVNKLIKFYLD